MEQYISKNALIAEIARQKAQWRICKSSEAKYRREMLDDISSFIDTLEVKEVQEEPVSNNYSALLPCIYNRTLEERVKYCKYCSAACEGRVKEPVSEDLEKAVNAYISNENNYSHSRTDTFKAGANWQKKKKKKSMEIMDEVYFKSCDMIRKQMIDKACKYLQEHREEVETEDNGISGWISDEFIENFRKNMEE